MTYDWLNISTLSGQVFGNSVDTYDGWLFITTNSGADLTDVTDTVTVDLNLLSDSEDIATSAITREFSMKIMDLFVSKRSYHLNDLYLVY